MCQYRVPGEIKSREVELDLQPRRDHEQGGGAGLRKLDFFRFGLFLNSSATDIVFMTAQARQLKQQLRSALVAAQWRGDTAFNTPIVLVAVRSFSGGIRGRAFTLSSSSLLSPSLMSILASADVKQNGI